MSVDPGGMETGSDPQNATMDFDEESTLDDNEVLEPIDESDMTDDRQTSIYDTSWVPNDRPDKRTDFGTTLTEMREGESLDRRLSEDEPDVLAQALGDPVDQILGPRTDSDDPNFEESDAARLTTEADAADDPEIERLLEEEGGDTDFPAAEFEEEQPRAGRLVEPDEGLESDAEKDMIAYDAGISGAGASAEEAAVHIVEEP